MSRIFKLDKAPYHDRDILFKRKEVEIQPGVTVLVGCNGCGKSTLLRYMEEALKKDKIPTMTYNNVSDGGGHAIQMALHQHNGALMGTLACSSEGEQIVINVSEMAGKLGPFVRQHAGESEIWILLDAVDSGLSIDNIIDLKEFFQLVITTNPNSDVYIVVSANSYEMASGQNCFDVRLGKYRTFGSYTTYRNFILRSKEQKKTRFKE